MARHRDLTIGKLYQVHAQIFSVWSRKRNPSPDPDIIDNSNMDHTWPEDRGQQGLGPYGQTVLLLDFSETMAIVLTETGMICGILKHRLVRCLNP